MLRRHMAEPRPIGIDLGTTYSCVAHVQENGRTAMIRNSKGEILTPTAVLFEDDEIVVGKDAKKVGALKIGRYAECVKRDMGSAVYSRPIRNGYLPPEVIQAYVLKELRADAARVLGPDLAAVITVPAFFDEPRRKATADAGAIASLEVLDIVNEPTAAALAFGEVLGYLDPSGMVARPIIVLVYDLGGGTFDVTLLEMQPGKFRTLATDGDVHLGGRDWDLRLADYVAEEFIKSRREDPRQNPGSMQQLLFAVEDAKHTLSLRHSTTVQVEHAGTHANIPVTRELFAARTADLLERTAFTTRQLLATAGVSWDQISHVLLVGGATRMPMVREMLHKLSGLEPDHRVHPDEAVARGAAIYARWLMDSKPTSGKRPTFQVTNASSHSLGIEGVDPTTQRRRNAILIPRNTPLPARVTDRFVTRKPNQTSIVIKVLEGESTDPDACTLIGCTSIRQLPPGLPAEWPVEITYEYAANGRLSIRGQVQGTDRWVEMELEREGMLSGEQLGRWKQVVAAPVDSIDFDELVCELLTASAGSPYAPGPASRTEPSHRPTSPGQTAHTQTPPGTTASGKAALPIPVAGKDNSAAALASPGAGVALGPAIPAQDKPASPPVDAPARREALGATIPAWDKPVRPLPASGSSAAPAPQAGTSATGAARAGLHVPGASLPSVQQGGPSGRMGVEAAGMSLAGRTPTASGALTDQAARVGRYRRSSSSGLLVLAGYAVAAFVGLVGGYYLLCALNPHANFLNLHLPGLRQPAPAQPLETDKSPR
jgi:molecular chaperone DnaK